MRFLREAARRAGSSFARSTRGAASTSSPIQPPLSSSPGFHPEHLGETPVQFMRVPLVLGVAGAIPFIALATPLASVFGEYVPSSVFPLDTRADAQARYGAVVASFLGGMHWGFASGSFANAGGGLPTSAMTSSAAKQALLLAGPLRFLWSVVPSLLAWPFLMCATPYALVGVGATLVTGTCWAFPKSRHTVYGPWSSALLVMYVAVAFTSNIYSTGNSHEYSTSALFYRSW